MIPQNSFIHVKKIENDVIAWDDANEYEVISCASTDPICVPGDTVVVEDDNIIKVNVRSKEKYFVREELVLAVIKSGKDDQGST